MDVLNTNIDLKDYVPGEYEVKVVMSEDANNYIIAENVSVKVVITGDDETQEEIETQTKVH